MELFTTDLAKLDFLLEADALLLDEELQAAALAAEEVVTEELPPDKRPKYITNYIGSKQKLVDWIWRNTPEDIKSVFDAFSGSAVVGYMYKSKGLQVITNDRLRFAYHVARAIIENNNTRLSAEDIERLTKDNPKAGDFVQKTFKGIFYAPGVHKIIDNIRVNIDDLYGYKKDIALFALVRACLSGKGGFGHFSATNLNEKRSDTPKEFTERFANLCNRVNALVFDNGHENKAYNHDIMELAPKVKADMAYFDPPYATHFSTTNYEKSYHFLEGLMTYWKDKEIVTENKAKNYITDAPTVTQSNAQEFFTEFLSKSKHIKYWLISYRDQAYPSEAQLKSIISAQGKASRMKSKDHHYSITSKHGEASYPKEHLFVCTPSSGAKAEDSRQSDVGSQQSNSGYRLQASGFGPTTFGLKPESPEVRSLALTADLYTEAVWEETANEIRYRMRDPQDFIPETFRRKKLEGVEGVSIIIAKLKPEKVPEGHDPEAMVLQAYRFVKKTDDNPDGWTMDKAKEWIEKQASGSGLPASGQQQATGFWLQASDQNHLACSPEPEAQSLSLEGNMGEIADLSLDNEFDPDMLCALAGKADNILVTGYIGNKHFIMEWLDKHVPKGVKSIFDAFSGGANVGYYFKRKGLQVFANDLMKYPYHIARAVVENNTVTLSDEDVEMLLASNPKAKSFIVDTFHGYYFTKPILEFLDNTYANIQNLSGYKKDLALTALGHTCKAKAVFGEFARSKKALRQNLTEHMKYKSPENREKITKESSLGNIPLPKFISTFKHYIEQLNSLVYDNGQENKVYNGEILSVMPRVKADLIYCDPPYITEFGANDYEGKYHFVEGLMSYWEGKDIQDNQRKSFPSRTKYNKETMAELFDKLIVKAQQHYPNILISYRDKAFPNQQEITDMLKGAYKDVKVKSISVEYGIVNYDSKAGGKYAKELLFVASNPLKTEASGSRLPASGQKQLACSPEPDARSLIHTSFPVEIGLQAVADDGVNGDGLTGDKRFGFILCHAGTNKNGDHFTVEELSSRYQTAINKKIDLKHAQDITDIVGGVVASDFVHDERGSRVECVGELYTQDSENSRLAYKLMKKGIITQVSMECDYQEGECSICHKRFTNKADYCIHLKKYKGGQFEGKPVYEILHGVTFSGLGLLDKKGADENAKITTVSDLSDDFKNQGGKQMPEMDEKDKQKLDDEAAKKEKEVPPADEKDKDALIKKLQSENQKLKQQVSDLQKQIEKYEAESKAAARKVKAEKLITKLEQKGMAFTDQEREVELKRLSELSDDAFTATEAAYDRMPTAGKKEKEQDKEKDKKGKKETSKSKADGDDKNMRTDAGVDPLVMEDDRATLENKLKTGFRAAYRERIGKAV
ncbi:MAG: DNA adenine methylase [Candidatus Schekmanbacteria bacterium]|nr:DNA adenine methylase [Candidatus Schekmanbacteria bacterium]